jgi:hypothetical protein
MSQEGRTPAWSSLSPTSSVGISKDPGGEDTMETKAGSLPTMLKVPDGGVSKFHASVQQKIRVLCATSSVGVQEFNASQAWYHIVAIRPRPKAPRFFFGGVTVLKINLGFWIGFQFARSTRSSGT